MMARSWRDIEPADAVNLTDTKKRRKLEVLLASYIGAAV